ncbi:hypothetical protein MNBD_GAMMA26-1524 [hydrothermal vent metagenome]|uniref:Uncharacterized protein n=1 Tax=hydrothermal vent metagenome TaxID=652676 RepID=A0A3B1BIH8_9ZZZZ
MIKIKMMAVPVCEEKVASTLTPSPERLDAIAL